MRTKHPNAPLSTRSPHLYVTRAATLAYQALTGSPFEASRRALTLRILTSARQDPKHKGCFLLSTQLPTGYATLRIWTEREGRLLVVPKIAHLKMVDAPH